MVSNLVDIGKLLWKIRHLMVLTRFNVKIRFSLLVKVPQS